ncbi:MAG: hypothetical protein QME68_07285 [Elusimicrobiota bacterium]|nr:hypothetical protein [Elusimicrobiota bacterium]
MKIGDCEILAELYGKRWNIDNFYRDGKGNFLVKTKTKSFTSRLFFLLLAVLLYNLWRLVRLMLGEVVAQTWKIEIYKLLEGRCRLPYSNPYERAMWIYVMVSLGIC